MMLSSYDELLVKPNNCLFDEGIAHCRKQQFDKAYQCFKKHLVQNRFCQETFQMLSYCHYKFSENLRNNVSDLQGVIKRPKSRQHLKNKKSTRYFDESCAVSQNTNSLRFSTDQGKSNITDYHSSNISRKLHQSDSLLSDLEKQKTLSLKSKPSSAAYSLNQPSKFTNLPKFSVPRENCGIDDFRTAHFLKQIGNYQSEMELFLKNIDNSLSNIEVQVNFLTTKELKIDSEVTSLLNLVTDNNAISTERFQFQSKYTSSTFGKMPVFYHNRPSPLKKKLRSWSVTPKRSYLSEKCNFYSVATQATMWPTYNFNYPYQSGNELRQPVLDRTPTQSDNNSSYYLSESGTEKSVPSVSLTQSTDYLLLNRSSKLDKVSPKIKLICSVPPRKQNISAKRKLDFPEIYFDCSPRKKSLLPTLFNDPTLKKKLNIAKKRYNTKRPNFQSRRKSFRKSISLDLANTFKMFKELLPVRDSSILSINSYGSGCRVQNLKKFRSEPHLSSVGKETYLNNVTLGFQSTKHAATQTDSSLSCSLQQLVEIRSTLHNSSGTVSLLHSSSIIPVNFTCKKVGLVSTNFACPPNCLNVFINEILSEIKDSLSFFSVDCIPLDLDADRTSLDITPAHGVKFALMPVSFDFFTNFNLRLLVRGHYIEFPNMRVYQVDPFWSGHSTCVNSQSLCLHQSQNQSSFIYPVCILLHSLSTDLYNLTLLAGPFRIRFVNFNSYFSVNYFSNHCDN